jgi:putative ABC transport system ATP-binding protein
MSGSIYHQAQGRYPDERVAPLFRCQTGGLVNSLLRHLAPIGEKQNPEYVEPEIQPRSRPIIDARHLTKVYRMEAVEVVALCDVSLVVYEGEFISIMGPSGSGKSTMLHILGALDQPTSGEYYLDGIDIAKLKDRDLAAIRNRKIGFVFQNFNLLPRTSALRQVELPLIYASAADRSKRAREALEAVGLGDRVYHRPNELSGGEQQRVAIARAIVTNPAIVLADEPTGNLDSRSGTEVLKIFQKMNRERGITTIFVTHDTFVARHTNRIVMLRDGQIVADRIVPNPYDAGSVDRPPQDATLQAIINLTAGPRSAKPHPA